MTNTDSQDSQEWAAQAYALLKKRQEEQKQELEKKEEKNKELDKIILIIANKGLRVSRVLARDKNRSKKEIDAIIDNQIDEKEATKQADIIIENDQKNMLLPKVIKCLDKLLKE